MSNTYKYDGETAWCPGCGNFGLQKIVDEALVELDLPQEKLAFVSGIGQAAKAPQYMQVSYFNGLHGRALPVATGIHAANPELKVLVQSGDGDMYGEGGNHFMHAIRRNPDLTVLVHNNMIYGLTKGQASPTTRTGMQTPVQVDGVFAEPFNPLAVAIALDASFVARGSVGERDLTRELIKKALNHKGFALVDIFQACVSFNKVNTHSWFKKNTKLIDDTHDPGDRAAALALALEEDPWPLGLFYRNENKADFEEKLAPYSKGDMSPLFKRKRHASVLEKIMADRAGK